MEYISVDVNSMKNMLSIIEEQQELIAMLAIRWQNDELQDRIDETTKNVKEVIKNTRNNIDRLT